MTSSDLPRWNPPVVLSERDIKDAKDEADRELGALVRKMPEEHLLIHDDDGWRVISQAPYRPKTLGEADTPEDALRQARAALGVEE